MIILELQKQPLHKTEKLTRPRWEQEGLYKGIEWKYENMFRYTERNMNSLK